MKCIPTQRKLISCGKNSILSVKAGKRRIFARVRYNIFLASAPNERLSTIFLVVPRSYKFKIQCFHKDLKSVWKVITLYLKKKQFISLS